MHIYDYRPLLTRRTSRRIEHRENGQQLLFHTLVLYTRLTAENNVALLEEAAIFLFLSLSLDTLPDTLIYDRAVGNFSSMRPKFAVTKHNDD